MFITQNFFLLPSVALRVRVKLNSTQKTKFAGTKPARAREESQQRSEQLVWLLCFAGSEGEAGSAAESQLLFIQAPRNLKVIINSTSALRGARLKIVSNITQNRGK